MMSKVFASRAALGLALAFVLSGAALAAPEPTDPPCKNQFASAPMFGPLELGSKWKGPGKRPGYSGAWAVGYDWNDAASVKHLELKTYKGALPFGLSRGDNIATVRKKLSAHFTGVSILKSQDTWPDHQRAYTAFCVNKLGMGQRFEVAFSKKGVMFALIVAGWNDTYERDYPQ